MSTPVLIAQGLAATYLEYAEYVNLKVLAIINEAGTSLALPKQTM